MNGSHDKDAEKYSGTGEPSLAYPPPPLPPPFRPDQPQSYAGAPAQPQYPDQQNGAYSNYNNGNNVDYNQPQNFYNNAPPIVNYDTKPPPYEAGSNFNQVFAVKSKRWNDWWGIPIILAFLAGFVVVSGIGLNAYSKSKSFQGTGIYSNTNTFSLNTNTVILFVFTTVVGVVFSILWLCLARAITKKFIYFSLICHLIVAWGTCIFYLVMKYWSAGIVFLVFAVLSTWFFFVVRSRIPFATLVLQTVIDATRAMPSVYMVSIIGTVISGLFSVWVSITFVTIYIKYDPNPNNPGCNIDGGSCSNGKLIGLIAFVVFCGFYLSEVIKNIIYTTLCGAFGSWYYCYKSVQGMPKHPALGAFKRSMTTSLGSIGFGSLLVAIVSFLREICVMFRMTAQQDGNIVAVFLLGFVQCILGILDWLVTFLNHYAYSFIALYGKAFIPAAKDTWTIIKDRGLDAIINDSIISSVLILSSTLTAYLCALFAYLFLRLTHPAYNQTGGFYAPVVALAFAMGLQINNITNVTINSGVTTFFIALAKDPEVFKMCYPDIYEDILSTYPKIKDKLNIQ